MRALGGLPAVLMVVLTGCGSTQFTVPASDPTPPSAVWLQADLAVINFIAANGGTIHALDGDAVSDTPPDPSPILYLAHKLGFRNAADHGDRDDEQRAGVVYIRSRPERRNELLQ